MPQPLTRSGSVAFVWSAVTTNAFWLLALAAATGVATTARSAPVARSTGIRLAIGGPPLSTRAAPPRDRRPGSRCEEVRRSGRPRFHGPRPDGSIGSLDVLLPSQHPPRQPSPEGVVTRDRIAARRGPIRRRAPLLLPPSGPRDLGPLRSLRPADLSGLCHAGPRRAALQDVRQAGVRPADLVHARPAHPGDRGRAGR